jgi:hypothetical protein
MSVQVTDMVSVVGHLGNSMAASLGGDSTYDAATGLLTTNLRYGSKTYGSVQSVLDQINSSVDDVAKQASSNTAAIDSLGSKVNGLSSSTTSGSNASSSGATAASGTSATSTSSSSGTQGSPTADAVSVSQFNAAQAASVQYARSGDGTVDYGNVTLGSAATPAQIHNVAAGTASGDAVNVGQLNAGIQTAENWAKDYVDRKLQNIGQTLNTVSVRANAGVASAMAMAGLPQAYQPNQNAAAVAFGTFHGQTGMAVGVSTVSESGRWVYKLNMSGNTRGDLGASVGAAVTW